MDWLAWPSRLCAWDGQGDTACCGVPASSPSPPGGTSHVRLCACIHDTSSTRTSELNPIRRFLLPGSHPDERLRLRADSFIPSVPFICSNDSWFSDTVHKLHRPEDPLVRPQTQLQDFPPRHSNGWPASPAGRSMDSYAARIAARGGSGGGHPMDDRPVLLATVLCAVVLVILAACAAVVRRVQRAPPGPRGDGWALSDDRRKALLLPRGVPLVRPGARFSPLIPLRVSPADNVLAAAVPAWHLDSRTCMPNIRVGDTPRGRGSEFSCTQSQYTRTRSYSSPPRQGPPGQSQLPVLRSAPPPFSWCRML